MTNSLQKLQNSLQNYLLTGNTDITEQIDDVGLASKDEKLNVYGDAYYIRLLSILKEDFPVLTELLGDLNCDAFFTDYLKKYPSTSATVRNIGQYLVEYIQTLQDFADKTYFCELAEFEWTLVTAFDAPDSPILSTEDLAQIPQRNWPDLKLKTVASLHYLSCHWNVVELWLSYDKERKLDQAQLQYSSTPETWIVWRPEYQNRFLRLSELEVSMLRNIQQGKTFADICELLLEFLPEEDVAQSAIGTLVKFCQEGILSAIEIDECE